MIENIWRAKYIFKYLKKYTKNGQKYIVENIFT